MNCSTISVEILQLTYMAARVLLGGNIGEVITYFGW